jgi:hypothetical protein
MRRAEIRQLQAIVTDYIAAGEAWPAQATDVARWAIRRKLWEPSRGSQVHQCANQLARAMREEYIEDAQGRPV